MEIDKITNLKLGLIKNNQHGKSKLFVSQKYACKERSENLGNLLSHGLPNNFPWLSKGLKHLNIFRFGQKIFFPKILAKNEFSTKT